MTIPRMVSIKEAASEAKVPVNFVRTLIRQNKIPFVRTGTNRGSKYLLNLNGLYDYLENGDRGRVQHE